MSASYDHAKGSGASVGACTLEGASNGQTEDRDESVRNVGRFMQEW